MSSNQLVTVVIHFNNACAEIESVISGMRNQTHKQLQVICTANHLNFSQISEAIKRCGDKRFVLLECESDSKTVAFNMGLSAAKGEYICFLSSGDDCKSELIDIASRKLEETSSDLVLFDYGVKKSDGKTDRIKTSAESGDTIAREVKALNTAGYFCALFRRSFLLENHISFSAVEEFDYDDIFFLPVCIAAADNIAYVGKQLILIPDTKNDLTEKEMMPFLDYRKNSADYALKFAEEKLGKDRIREAFISYVLVNCINPFISELIDCTDVIARDYYRWMREIILKMGDTAADYCKSDSIAQRFFGVLKQYTADEYFDLVDRKIYISMTSYPARLKYARACIETLLKQTKKSNGILLWLAEEEYPNGFEDIPEEIIELHENQQITIRWCDRNLKPHKKYYYAFKEYPNDLIVTVDDDLIYKNDMLITLFISYLEKPKAVSAMRTHLMCFDEDRQLLSYSLWIKNSNVCVNEESMQLMATTGAGTLFLPKMLDSVLFNTDAIKKCCINADDLWLKCVELISGTPVVQAAQARELEYVKGTQEVGLWSTVNIYENDSTLKMITDWMDENVEQGLLYRRMTSSEIGKNMMLAENIFEGIAKDRNILLVKQAKLERELNKEKEKTKKIRRELTQKKKDSNGSKTGKVKRKVLGVIKNIQ